MLSWCHTLHNKFGVAKQYIAIASKKFGKLMQRPFASQGSLRKSCVSDAMRGRSLGRSVLQYTWRLTAAVSLWETSSTAADCNLHIWMLLIDREFVSVSLVPVLLMYYLVSSLHNDLFFLCLLCIKPLSWEPNHQQYNGWSGMQEKLNILIQTI